MLRTEGDNRRLGSKEDYLQLVWTLYKEYIMWNFWAADYGYCLYHLDKFSELGQL